MASEHFSFVPSESQKVTPVRSFVEIALRILTQTFTSDHSQEGSLTHTLKNHGRRMLRDLLPQTNQ